MKQEFLSTMSHEIRTPLNAVISIATLLGERTDPAEKDLIDSLKFASNSLLLIINDILDFTSWMLIKYNWNPAPASSTL